MPTTDPHRPHKPVDSMARRVIRINPQGLLPWLAGLPGLTPIRPLDTAFITTQRTTDALWEVRLRNGTLAIILVEIEWVPGKNTAARLNAYAALVEAATNLPVIPIVVCLAPPPGGKPLDGIFRRRVGRTAIRRRFIVVNLWQTPVAEAFVTGHEGLLPFVPFMDGCDDATITQAFASLGQHDWGQDIELLMLYLVQRLRGPEGLAHLGRRLNMQTLTQAPWYAEILEEGLVKGRAEGLVEGRTVGLLALLTRLCEERFVVLTGAQRDWLASLSEAEINVAAPLVARCASMPELMATVRRK